MSIATSAASDSVPGSALEGFWTAVAALGIAAFSLVSTEFLPVGLLPQIARELDQSESRVGQCSFGIRESSAFLSALTCSP